MTDLDEMRRDRNRALDRIRKRRILLANLNGVPTSLVDAAPIRVRVNALTDLGYSYEAIAAMHGTGTPAGIRLLALGHHQRAERKFAGLAELPITLRVHPAIADESWVPTLGATRRLRSLMRLGWRHEDVRPIVGRSTHVLVGNTTPQRIKAIDWRLVDAAWRQLCAVPGPSTASRTRAERLGYAAPLAWDDIDDPFERPVCEPRGNDEIDPTVVTRLLAGRRVQSTRAEKVEALRRWVANGGSEAAFCRTHGWKPGRYKVSGVAA